MARSLEERGNWAQVRSMGTARSGVAAAAFDGSLFVVGGWDGTRRLRTGEVICNCTHLLIITNKQQ